MKKIKGIRGFFELFRNLFRRTKKVNPEQPENQVHQEAEVHLVSKDDLNAVEVSPLLPSDMFKDKIRVKPKKSQASPSTVPATRQISRSRNAGDVTDGAVNGTSQEDTEDEGISCNELPAAILEESSNVKKSESLSPRVAVLPPFVKSATGADDDIHIKSAKMTKKSSNISTSSSLSSKSFEDAAAKQPSKSPTEEPDELLSVSSAGEAADDERNPTRQTSPSTRSMNSTSRSGSDDFLGQRVASESISDDKRSASISRDHTPSRENLTSASSPISQVKTPVPLPRMDKTGSTKKSVSSSESLKQTAINEKLESTLSADLRGNLSLRESTSPEPPQDEAKLSPSESTREETEDREQDSSSVGNSCDLDAKDEVFSTQDDPPAGRRSSGSDADEDSSKQESRGSADMGVFRLKPSDDLSPTSQHLDLSDGSNVNKDEENNEVFKMKEQEEVEAEVVEEKVLKLERKESECTKEAPQLNPVVNEGAESPRPEGSPPDKVVSPNPSISERPKVPPAVPKKPKLTKI